MIVTINPTSKKLRHGGGGGSNWNSQKDFLGGGFKCCLVSAQNWGNDRI